MFEELSMDVLFSDMADDALFEFLHMEIVAHVYKEHATRDDIDKVHHHFSYFNYVWLYHI